MITQESQQDMAKFATYGGAATATLFGKFTVNEWAAIFGVLIALLGLIIQTYFKIREDRRRSEYWDARRKDDDVFLSRNSDSSE